MVGKAPPYSIARVPRFMDVYRLPSMNNIYIFVIEPEPGINESLSSDNSSIILSKKPC